MLNFSAASLWEIAIKASPRRDDFIIDPRELRTTLRANRYIELAVSGGHAVAVGSLPHNHGDPFDRLLLAQAIEERLTLVTTDHVLATYPGPILKV